MKCPNCNKEISDGFKFCPYCATPIVANKCPHCGSTNLPADSKFCPDCGTEIHVCQNYEPDITGYLRFFPINGITLGQTSIHDVLTPSLDGSMFKGVYNGLKISQYTGENAISIITLSPKYSMPEKLLTEFGFNWRLSYQGWKELFKRLKLDIEDEEIEVNEETSVETIDGHPTYVHASLTAYMDDTHTFELLFSASLFLKDKLFSNEDFYRLTNTCKQIQIA